MLAMLDALMASNSVTYIAFSLYTPLTPAIATAVASLGPKLTGICLMHGLEHFDAKDPVDFMKSPPPPAAAEVESAAATVEKLLRLVGPRLERITVCTDPAGRYVPAQSLRSLALCTALQKLSLQLPSLPEEDGAAVELSALRAITALSSLRNLELWGGGKGVPPLPQRPAMAATLGEHLAQLTALTRLCVNLRRLRHYHSSVDRDPDDEDVPLSEQLTNLEAEAELEEAAQLRAAAAAEWRAVASAVRCMPGLQELRTPLQADLADLTALTALTCFRVGALTLPDDVARDATFTLPPSLRRAETHAPVSVRLVAALQPPVPPAGGEPCTLLACGRLWRWYDTPWVVEFERSDVDDGRDITQAAVAAVKRAVGVLGKFGVREPDVWPRGVRIWAQKAFVGPPPVPGEGVFGRGGSHIASWLGELASLRLDWLSLSSLMLSPRDLLGIARCFTGLQGLDLCGSLYSVASLPLLGGLRQLRTLELNVESWREEAEFSFAAQDAVESAFMALTAAEASEEPASDGAAGAVRSVQGPLPRLQKLTVECPAQHMQLMQSLLAPAMQELSCRGNGAELVLLESS